MYTFTDWNNYTDLEGTPRTLDWSSEEAIRGKFCSAYMDALYQAAVFRYSHLAMAQYDPMPILDDPYAPKYVSQTYLVNYYNSNMVWWIEYVAWHSAYEAPGWIAGYYSNGGVLPDLSGRPTVRTGLTLSTEAKILAEIGDSEKIPPPTVALWGRTMYPITAAWVYQIYKVFRAQRWLWAPAGLSATIDTSTVQYRYATYTEATRYGTTDAYNAAAAEALFNATPWTLTPSTDPYLYSLQQLGRPHHFSRKFTPTYPTPREYTIARLKSKLKFTNAAQVYPSEVTAYFSPFYPQREWWDASCLDYGVPEDALLDYYLTAGGVVSKPDALDVLSNYIGDFGDATCGWDDPWYMDSKGWSLGRGIYTLENYAVEGGFPLM